jgi:hypothetical protein
MSGGFLFRWRAHDGDENTPLLQHFPRTVLRFAANGVKHDINIMHDILKFGSAIVDDFIGSKLTDEFEALTRGCADDMRPLPFGKLNSKTTDTTCGGMDEDFLTGLQFGGVEQRLPRGERSRGQGGGLDMIKRSGFFRHLDDGGQGKFRIATAFI